MNDSVKARGPSTQLRNTLRAWADIDRLQTLFIKTPEKRSDRWMVEIDANRLWPHQTAKPARFRKDDRSGSKPKNDRPGPEAVIKGRVYVSCFDAGLLKMALEKVLSQRSERLSVIGLDPSRPKERAQVDRTCRAYFDIDADGRPIMDSFGFSPLPDLVALIERERASGTVHPLDAIRKALPELGEVEESLRLRFLKSFEEVEEGESPLTTAQRAIAALAAACDHWKWLSGNDLSHWSYTVWTRKPDELQFDLMRSFFRRDLLEAAANSREDGLLGRYLLADEESIEKHNVSDRSTLEAILDPSKLPRASWPTTHLPRLGQQVAVTTALDRLRGDSVVAVNGPPGTGKTTLLRDFYANVLVERAIEMVKFEKPGAAFTLIEHPALSGLKNDVFAVAASLTGREMLLASTNNEALRNVTLEMPRQSEIGKKYQPALSYFREEANWTPPPADDVDEHTDAMDEDPATIDFEVDDDSVLWGFASGVAGSKKNTGELFKRLGTFVKPQDGGLLQTLWRQPTSTAQWNEARRDFNRATQEVESMIADRIGVWAALREVDGLKNEANALESAVDHAVGVQRVATDEEEVAKTELSDLNAAIEETGKRVAALANSQPSLWRRLTDFTSEPEWSISSRFLKSARHERWKAACQKEKQRCDNLRRRQPAAERRARDAIANAIEADNRLRSLDRRAREVGQSLRSAESAIEGAPAYSMDDEWWKRSLPDRELGTAWIDPDLHDAQAALFAAAMRVHEAFIRQAGQQIVRNIRTLKTLLLEGMTEEQRTIAALPAWQSLFLLVPMISTTFASVERLLADVPEESLGFLLIDEAGQATPHAAVGALRRSKCALVVGDPAQLEPVVSLHEVLIDALILSHHASPALSPLRVSVQTMADKAAIWGTTRTGKWIGLPLRVHQRCLHPMFDIARDMVYPDMVQGRTTEPDNTIVRDLPESSWQDVRHLGGSHWNANDWERIHGVLANLPWEETKRLPSMAVISPFTDVVEQLRDACSRFLEERNLSWNKELQRKIKVGTVHTFQGQQREIVWLVLGGDPERPGAIEWVTATLNLLNVAVTRAQDRLYVVGDAENWADSNHAKFLSYYLPR